MITVANLSSAAARPAPVVLEAMPMSALLRAYLAEALFELRRMLRTPAFAVPFLVLPVGIYLLFGVVVSADAIAKNPAIATYLFSGFSVMAVAGPALFGIGVSLALERDAGLMKLKRAMPVPPGSYILAKMLMSVVFAALAVGALILTALLAGKLTVSGTQLAMMAGVLVLGSLPFCAIGLFVGVHSSGPGAPAFVNLIYLPMLWLSGLFVPLPKFLQPWSVIWPAFHLNQMALAAGGLRQFSFMPAQICAAVLVGVTVLFGGLAIRRLARIG
jgi:ABC-2 type transport system permease protein